MVATASRSVTSKDGKLRFGMPGQQGFRWKRWDEMTEDERAYVRLEHPDYAAQHGGLDEVAPQQGRYQYEIEYYQQRLEECRVQHRQGRDGIERGMAKAWGEQLKAAIQNLKEAEQIPEGTVGWFVCYPGEFNTDVPPVGLDGVLDRSRRIESSEHVIRTNNPEHIAWLRSIIRKHRSEDDYGAGPFEVGRMGNVTIAEVPEGQFPILTEAGDLIGFGPVAMYWRQLQSITRLA